MQNLLSEGGQITFNKNNLEHISGKVNEGDEIIKIYNLFRKKVNKKQAKKHSNVFYFFK